MIPVLIAVAVPVGAAVAGGKFIRYRTTGESVLTSWRRVRHQRAIWLIRSALTDLGPLSGWELAQVTGLRCARVYPILDHMEGYGGVVSSWGEPNDKGHRRRFYRLPGTPERVQ